MSNFNCQCKFNCVSLSVIASIIIGIIAAVLNFTAVITVTPAFLWVVFGIAVVYLAVALLAATSVRCAYFCSILPALITGILGTILTAIILLAIEFAVTSVLGTLIVGALLAFFTLLITTTACALKCAAGCFRAD